MLVIRTVEEALQAMKFQVRVILPVGRRRKPIECVVKSISLESGSGRCWNVGVIQIRDDKYMTGETVFFTEE